MLCPGLKKYNTPIGQVAFGGIELVDLSTNMPVHLSPVQACIDEDGGAAPETLSASNNAAWIEPISKDTMRMYFTTETKDKADLVTNDVTRYEAAYPRVCGAAGKGKDKGAYKGKGKGMAMGMYHTGKGKGKGKGW